MPEPKEQDPNKHDEKTKSLLTGFMASVLKRPKTRRIAFKTVVKDDTLDNEDQ